MQMTLSELLGLAEAAIAASATPRTFGLNAALRRLHQVQKLVVDTGMAGTPVQLQKPEMSPAGKEAAETLQDAGWAKKKPCGCH